LIEKIKESLVKNKHYIVIAAAALIIAAYAVPYGMNGMNVEAQVQGGPNGNHYGWIQGPAPDCSHFTQQGPLRCR
jgi:hypothetical protein